VLSCEEIFGDVSQCVWSVQNMMEYMSTYLQRFCECVVVPVSKALNIQKCVDV